MVAAREIAGRQNGNECVAVEKLSNVRSEIYRRRATPYEVRRRPATAVYTPNRSLILGYEKTEAP